MSWNVAVPADGDKVRAGDDAIREMKSDVEAALGAEHSFPVNEAAPVAYHNFPAGNAAERPTASTATAGRLYLDTDIALNGDYLIQRDNGASWDNLTDISPFPSGTTAFFCQSTAPTGWARSSAIDDRMLRVNSSTGGGTSGAWGITIAAVNFTHAHGSSTASGNFDSISSHSGSTHLFENGLVTFPIIGLAHPSTAHPHDIGSQDFNHGHSIASTWKPSYYDLIMAVKN